MIVNAGDEYSNFMEMDPQTNAFGFGAASGELNNDNFADHISPRQENVNPTMTLDTNERFHGSFKANISNALAAFDKVEAMATVTYPQHNRNEP